jgi:hypothetical protein
MSEPAFRVRRLPGNPVLRREASVTMAAVLASFGTVLFIEREARPTASIVILAVALALSIGRVSSRQGSRSALLRLLRLLGVLVLPLIAVGANEIGTRMLERPNLGDTLFVVAVSATIWVRRFGPVATHVGILVTLPLIATLVVPVVAGSGSGSSDNQRWWAALVAIVSLGWVSAAQLLAERTGLLARPATVPETASPTSSGRSGGGSSSWSAVSCPSLTVRKDWSRTPGRISQRATTRSSSAADPATPRPWPPTAPRARPWSLPSGHGRPPCATLTCP